MTVHLNPDNVAYFSIDILFEEALDFDLSEIAEAVSEDYPLTPVEVHPVDIGKNIKTDQVIFGMLKPQDARNGHVVLMNGTGSPDEEFRAADHSEIAWRSGGYAHCALDAIKSHKSYMTLSIQTFDQSLEGKFRAVRQLMAVSAVFAQLPIAIGILVHWSSHMIAASTWVKGVQKTMRGEWPLSEWFSFRCGWEATKHASNRNAVGYTKGLRNFLGFELHVAAAPISPSDAKSLLRKACLATLQDTRNLRDRHTFTIENDQLRYKAHRSQNANGTPGAVMVLLHPAISDHDTADLDLWLPRSGSDRVYRL
ncbi:MAG: hypothetical protein WBV62_19340 [Roseobacter sp.]